MLNRKVLIGGLVAGAFLLPSIAGAAMVGTCSTCHTMHNSADGTAMAPNTTLATPNEHLLMADCAGCHAEAGQDNAAGTGKAAGGFQAPQVDGDTTTNNNAGGYFDTGNGDNMQHNVFDIFTAAGADVLFGTTLNTIPGDAGSTYTQTSCTGCHGGSGAHHASAPTAAKGGTGAADTYRLLSQGTAFVAGTGIANFGVADSGASEYASNSGDDMNAFCAGCHPDFHGESTADTDVHNGTAWIRHPVGNLMGAMDTNYDAAVTGDITTLGVTPVMDYGTGTYSVMCISCHRPHGSQWDDLLRFNYSAVTAGGTTDNGCESCHGSY